MHGPASGSASESAAGSQWYAGYLRRRAFRWRCAFKNRHRFAESSLAHGALALLGLAAKKVVLFLTRSVGPFFFSILSGASSIAALFLIYFCCHEHRSGLIGR